MTLLIIHTGIIRITADLTVFTDMGDAPIERHIDKDCDDPQNHNNQPGNKPVIRRRKCVHINRSAEMFSTLGHMVSDMAIHSSENEIRRLQADFENRRHLLN